MKKWNPIINDNSIEEKIDEIYKSLSDPNRKDIGLMNGQSGIALFYFYYGRYKKNEESINKGIEIFENLFDIVNQGGFPPSFAGGVTGFSWFAEHILQEGFLDKKLTFDLEMLYPLFVKIMTQYFTMGNYDFLHGAGGIALYFLSKKKMDGIESYLEKFIDIMMETKEEDQGKVKWPLIDLKTMKKKENEYNISLSHGISSIVAILTKMYSKNVCREKALQLLNGTIEFILSNRQDENEFNSYFPYKSLEENGGDTSRMAWCYGDLGIGITLYRAAKELKRVELESFAVKVLLRSTQRRDLEETKVVDAALCHGSVGIAHIYNKMFNFTGKIEFKDAAGYWFKQTLDMAKFDNNLAGYKSWSQNGYEDNYGFLEGIAGTGLALISAVSDIEPKWDESLLLS